MLLQCWFLCFIFWCDEIVFVIAWMGKGRKYFIHQTNFLELVNVLKANINIAKGERSPAITIWQFYNFFGFYYKIILCYQFLSILINFHPQLVLSLPLISITSISFSVILDDFFYHHIHNLQSILHLLDHKQHVHHLLIHLLIVLELKKYKTSQLGRSVSSLARGTLLSVLRSFVISCVPNIVENKWDERKEY